MFVRALLLVVAALALVSGTAPAQGRIFKPDVFERATKVDENGMIQWAEHKKIECPNCKGTGKHPCKTCERYIEEADDCRDCGRNEKREAVCRACAGTGFFLDPLEKALCPGCQGTTALLCVGCGGAGKGKDKNGKVFTCNLCRGKAKVPCTVCKGERTVPGAKLKPSIAEASAKDLRKALAVTDEALQGVSAFAPVGKNTRKELKAFLKTIKGAEKVHPALKQYPKFVKEFMKLVYAGSSYEGQQEREVHAMEMLKGPVDYYLQHQKRILELALARAEANEKTLAEQKGK